ncbi:MAG TPA: DUF4097 family beta strand repeat-containing protein [Chthoniobacterales bacterium]|nr:DUF4097 family beta strand repeat-containing protein [Chthoniobacterales bacterium]
MARIFPWSSAAILGAFLLVAGCSKTFENAATEVVDQSYPLDPTARLTIRNLNGSISIQGADTAELKLHAIKKAGSSAQLRNITINVAVETGSVSIATSVVPQTKRSPLGSIGTVDYELIVPRTARIARLDLEDGKVLVEGMGGDDVRANVVDGQLTLRNCCANLHLTLANGDLDLSFERCGPRPFFAEAQITHGSARVALPQDASIRARAQTMKGKVINEFTDIVNVNGRSLQKVDLSLGSNTRSELAIHVTTGDIRLVALKSNAVTASQTASVAGSE